ncbi:MAG: SCO family protein [Gammaproteobacteria bacterium]|nr:SCO family protein [Gammaproteobacteria bacterium]
MTHAEPHTTAVSRLKGTFRWFSWAAVILASGLLLGWAVSSWNSTSDQSLALTEVPQGGDFTLSAPHGPFRLQDMRGKVVLIYFGYTFCPDICPTNLALISQALNALTEEELTRVQGLFVSVDPARDTLERLARYADYFHPAIMAATGDPDTVARTADLYGAAYRKVEGESQGGYLVDHSSYTYVIAPDGSLSASLPHATPPSEILEITRLLLARYAK